MSKTEVNAARVDDDWQEYRPADLLGDLNALAYISKLERHVGVLQDKLWSETDGKTCACGWDDPDDVCMTHFPAAGG